MDPRKGSALRRGLDGRVVLVTRSRERAESLVAMLEDRGARALLAPAISLAPAPSEGLDPALRDVVEGGFSWVVLTSPSGVEAMFGRLTALGLARGPIRALVAAVGAGTAGALRDRGVEPDLVPPQFTTEALGRSLPNGTGRVLLARADLAPGELEATLAEKGWTPVRVDAYRTRLARRMPAAAARALSEGRVDAVTFTSASTVQGFVKMASGLPGFPVVAGTGRPPTKRLPRVVCIGPVTARAAAEAGMPVDGVARPHTIEGLVREVERVLAPAVAGSGEADSPPSPPGP